MARRFNYCSLYALAFIMFCWGGMQTSFAAENPKLLTTIEEYAVFAAVLFPKEETIASTTKGDPVQKIYPDLNSIKLNGITGKYYRLSRFTIEGATKPGKGADQEMSDDYNRRNKKVYCLDEEMLMPLIPEDGKVVLVDPGEKEILEEGMVSSSETTYISRPGFNKEITRAILQINHVAGLEMGVGYQVYLEKSSSTGKWMIVAFDLNRRY